MSDLGGPHPGVVVLYENVKVAIRDGIVNVSVDTGKNEVVTQISQKDGTVVGGSNAPKK